MEYQYFQQGNRSPGMQRPPVNQQTYPPQQSYSPPQQRSPTNTLRGLPPSPSPSYQAPQQRTPVYQHDGQYHHPPVHNTTDFRRQNTSFTEHEVLSFDEKTNRRKSARHVELTRGNLVLDCPVPDKVLQNVRYTTGEEFTHMRYTAITCDPDDFIGNHYLLRPYISARKTELMIVMTMYNEDDKLFIKTMSSAIKNIAYLCTRGRSKTWGNDGWQKVVVVIVSDGRNKINQRVLKVLGAMGVYQDEIMQNNVGGRPVTGHLFEYTSQLMVDSDFNVRGQDKNVPPVQIMFCLKEKNAKKLNSHRWFFNAFAAQLNPNVCVLLDVGTKPSSTSIYHLWKAFDRDPSIGGACGEIKAELGTGWLKLLNPLVASQNFEYKMSNILDKPLESVFGYISVLPGAFSAYRYKALLNSSHGKGPLASYFKGEAMHGAGANAGIFESNMYLAEDRILCFELVVKKNQAWKLKYVKAAKAETDVPDTVPEFISQRRRWLNGSFFAAFYSIANFLRIWTSGQPFYRKIMLQIEFIYNAVQLVFNWFALGNFFLAFFFLTQSTTSNIATDPFRGYGSQLFDFFRSLYMMVIVTIFICSMGNRPQGSKTTYTICIILFAIIMATMLYCAAYTVYLALYATPNPVNFKSFNSIKAALKKAAFRDIVISVASTYGLYFFTSLLHREPWHMFTCLVQYVLCVPFYVNILMVYAFCNTHDVSWGTKGDNGNSGELGGAKSIADNVMKVDVPTEREDINAAYNDILKSLKVKEHKVVQHRDASTKKEDYYRNFRTNLVLAWMFSNAFLIVFFTSQTWMRFVAKRSIGNGSINPYLSFVFWSVTGLSGFRAFGSIWYLILRLLFG